MRNYLNSHLLMVFLNIILLYISFVLFNLQRLVKLVFIGFLCPKDQTFIDCLKMILNSRPHNHTEPMMTMDDFRSVMHPCCLIDYHAILIFSFFGSKHFQQFNYVIEALHQLLNWPRNSYLI